MTDKIKILFLCTGNSCRSQMAHGWASHLLADKVEAFSAGTDPHGMNPLAIRSMNDVGVDISNHTSDHISKYTDQIFNFVVTVCDNAKESCPIFHGDGKIVHFGFEDPPKLAINEFNDDARLPHYNQVRDEIRRFIEKIPEIL